MSPHLFQQAILTWFDQHGRKHLPWQQPANPYRVWVSEIMLQQTQVATVIPYFLRFTERFPDLASLARSETGTVLEYWAGLGYYARARNLHRAAIIVCEQHRGELPAVLAQLAALPGIGRSTAGAILSIAFGVRAPILDGNVKRVLTRFQGIEGWPGDASVQRRLWQLAQSLTPVQRVGDYTQAMMDLGATVCTRTNPGCDDCPVSGECIALAQGRTAQLPAPKPRKAIPVKTCFVLVLRNGSGEFLLRQRPPAGIWGGLWSLPEFADRQDLDHWCDARGIDPTILEPLPQRRHTFSHFHLDFTPVHGRIDTIHRIEEAGHSDWRNMDRNTALPAPIRKLLGELQFANDLRGQP
jgi:A/G-specific adenine glycosylase